MERTLWMLLGACVLLLRVGLALYLSGVSRSKNAGGAMLRAMIDAAVAILVFWAFGAAVADGDSRLILDWKDLFTVPDFFMAGMILCGTGVAIGATLERSRLAVVPAISILLAGIIIPLSWRLIHDPRFTHLGLIDTAGATFILWPGGLCAAVAAYMLGARNGKRNTDGSSNVIPGHSVPLAAAGVLLMFVMWIPYVLGTASLQSAPDISAPVEMNIILAGSAAALAALLYSHLKYSKADVHLIFTGLLGGLVAITAGAATMSTRQAVLTGLVAGIIIPYATVSLDLFWKIDDPAGGIAIHAVGALWGVIAAAVFAPDNIPRHLLAAAVALSIIGLLTVVLTWTMFAILKATIGIRSREADEFDGLDLAEHDLNAYPDFQQTMIKSYHLRET